ncbi:hypothetical protein [Flammeovirga kamogawensis]|uniref:PIR Superfamily Protein n=1 Tax=Flammeovirga kamogawensis TaxID=373891 RepID=A0ABX8GSD3_9BACT|nr:hypothetical protein [Flammeovirga kamogawensis]MBB6461407.1 hypothetical protein [Flammeovirga kamogawensis]QWG06306.1 hypothetical protein KM029_13290 [Flammeovirga kamogawensis]TRX68135.1 hypothetical protein EO216_08305 [Flammeovirga kamogawensis]
MSEQEVTHQKYYYSYSYLYNWVNISENDDLECKLDTYFFLKLSTLFLEISLPNTHRKFERKYIKSLHLKKKKLILPLLIGGICGPLSLVAGSSGALSLFTGLSLFIAAFFIFYLGFVGTYQLQLKMFDGTENQFFLDYNVSDIQYFVNKANIEIRNGYR